MNVRINHCVEVDTSADLATLECMHFELDLKSNGGDDGAA